MFSLYIRAYWADNAIIDGSRTPPSAKLRAAMSPTGPKADIVVR
jgi:hypothetical protein